MGIVDVSDVKAPDLNMQVVVDAVETAISKPLIKRFIFVTEDINFGPLMLKLRQLGCSTTIMVMSEHIGDKLKPCVDEVVLLNSMLQVCTVPLNCMLCYCLCVRTNHLGHKLPARRASRNRSSIRLC